MYWKVLLTVQYREEYYPNPYKRQYELWTMRLLKENITAANSTFAIGGVSCSADNFVVAESFVLRINISGKNPAHRKSANR